MQCDPKKNAQFFDHLPNRKQESENEPVGFCFSVLFSIIRRQLFNIFSGFSSAIPKNSGKR